MTHFLNPVSSIKLSLHFNAKVNVLTVGIFQQGTVEFPAAGKLQTVTELSRSASETPTISVTTTQWKPQNDASETVTITRMPERSFLAQTTSGSAQVGKSEAEADVTMRNRAEHLKQLCQKPGVRELVEARPWTLNKYTVKAPFKLCVVPKVSK